MFLDSLEKKAIELIKQKFKVDTEIIDNEIELSLVVRSLFNKEIIYSHKQDLMPLYEAIRNRLEKETLTKRVP